MSLILVDSSVLIAVFRGTVTPAANRLRAIVRGMEPFAIPVICVQEVLQGARNDGEWRRLKAVLETQDLVFSDNPVETHIEAARIYFDCRRRGQTVRSSVDCLIAALALERGDVLLHDDDDFERIAKVRPLRMVRG